MILSFVLVFSLYNNSLHPVLFSAFHNPLLWRHISAMASQITGRMFIQEFV